MGNVRMVWDQPEIRRLGEDPEVVAFVDLVGEDFAHSLRAATPHLSGAGAASVAARKSRARNATDVGWDADHFYLIFPEYGTRFQHYQRFTRDLLERYAFLE